MQALAAAALAITFGTGCPPMAITTAATTGASVIADDRSLEQQAADLELKGSVDRALLEQGAGGGVNVDVYLGRIMLTGVVGDWAARRAAMEAARAAAADREIFDDIEVAPGGGFADEATNFAVNKELGANLLAAEGIASQSFLHRVVNGSAFILGEANDESQVETARQTALGTPGVRRVVTHIVVTQ